MISKFYTNKTMKKKLLENKCVKQNNKKKATQKCKKGS